MKTPMYLFLGAAIIGPALAVAPAAAQVQWGTAYKYAEGMKPTLAAHPSGLVLEFHRTGTGNTLWYHVGKLNGTTIAWGGSLRAPGIGTWPNVAITPDGYVLYIWSAGTYKSQSTLYYAVGKIDLNGNEGQAIQWLTSEGKPFDAGFHSTLSMNDSGLFVEAHESGTGGKGLYYRVGRIADPARGNYNLVWESGSHGRHYDDGINPYIAINNHNEVVEVHQVAWAEYFLHYHRGTVLSNGTIDFQASHRYADYGLTPTVVLLDNGFLLEVHSEKEKMIGSPGWLNPSNPSKISWSNRIDTPLLPNTEIGAALAINGTNPGPHSVIGSSGYDVNLKYVVGTIDVP
jgi:hypothetical protein